MLATIFIILAVLAAYVFVVRPRIRNAPAFAPWFDVVEKWEARLWKKSRTIFATRLTWLSGIIAGLATAFGAVDWHSVAMSLVKFMPTEYQELAVQLMIPIGLAVLGAIFGKLRAVTTEPLDDKE